MTRENNVYYYSGSAAVFRHRVAATAQIVRW